MYYVSKDKRTINSAELIWQGLEKCLYEKELRKVKIADISEKSYVSRATFYRLFDTVYDVLEYECDKFYENLTNELEQEHFSSNRGIILFFIERWLEQRTLIKALIENNLIYILHNAHMRKKS